MISTRPVATGSKPLARCGSSARMEMKVEAHSAAPVPTEAMNSQPVRVDTLGGAGAGEMAHADPGAEQAHGPGQQHQKLVVDEGVGRVSGMALSPWMPKATRAAVKGLCGRRDASPNDARPLPVSVEIG